MYLRWYTGEVLDNSMYLRWYTGEVLDNSSYAVSAVVKAPGLGWEGYNGATLFVSSSWQYGHLCVKEVEDLSRSGVAGGCVCVCGWCEVCVGGGVRCVLSVGGYQL